MDTTIAPIQSRSEIAERVALALQALNPSLSGASPDFSHWIEGPNGEIRGKSECTDFCRGCAEKRHAEAVAKDPQNADDYHLSGAYYAQESDSCRHCADCDAVLDYSLTEHGFASELEHFESTYIKEGEPLTIDVEIGWHLHALFEAWGEHYGTIAEPEDEADKRAILEIADLVLKTAPKPAPCPGR
jgi:hypothetical protein